MHRLIVLCALAAVFVGCGSDETSNQPASELGTFRFHPTANVVDDGYTEPGSDRDSGRP